MITQKEIWVNEHLKQETFSRLHTEKPSMPVPDFVDFLLEQGFVPDQTAVLDIGCGKGRNSIYLAQRGFRVTGTDFASQAVEEAQSRSESSGVSVQFEELDLTDTWPYQESQFRVVIDCNTTICIPNPGRANAIREACRILQPNGYYLFYGVGPTEMLKKFPGPEPNSGIFPRTGKFEKQYSKEELIESYQDFDLVNIESILSSDVIEGRITDYSMWVAVFRKK